MIGNFQNPFGPSPQNQQTNNRVFGAPQQEPQTQSNEMFNTGNTVPNSGFSGMGPNSGIPASMPTSAGPGSLLGNMAAGGTVGQYMPEGYDSGKFNDPTNANSTKYQVGRILSKYPPGPEGLQAAAAELEKLGIKVSGKDRITLPDGTTTDVGKAFSDPGANHAWQYNWSGPTEGNQAANPMAPFSAVNSAMAAFGNGPNRQLMDNGRTSLSAPNPLAPVANNQPQMDINSMFSNNQQLGPSYMERGGFTGRGPGGMPFNPQFQDNPNRRFM